MNSYHVLCTPRPKSRRRGYYAMVDAPDALTALALVKAQLLDNYVIEAPQPYLDLFRSLSTEPRVVSMGR